MVLCFSSGLSCEKSTCSVFLSVCCFWLSPNENCVKLIYVASYQIFRMRLIISFSFNNIQVLGKDLTNIKKSDKYLYKS